MFFDQKEFEKHLVYNVMIEVDRWCCIMMRGRVRQKIGMMLDRLRGVLLEDCIYRSCVCQVNVGACR